MASLDTCAAEVQKGNAPEERKIQRLFRNKDVTRMIKRCNDFGAGGVSVAIGELADGLDINLDAVRKKYEGLDGTELAISESQERMAVVVAPEHAAAFLAQAEAENLEAYQVAVVTQAPRLVLSWNGVKIADLSREFLNSNGADKHTSVYVPQLPREEKRQITDTVAEFERIATDPNTASQRGLVERFDGSIGASSVLMPFGGREQTSPAQAMAALIPVGPGHETKTCSVMAYGFEPYRSEQNPFYGAACSVVESVAKLVAAGCDYKEAYLSFQEYFEKLRDEPQRWGKPFSALMGALSAQIGLGAAAIGGKDSMSGSFLDLDVPPTVVSFAIAPCDATQVVSTEFKKSDDPVYFFQAPKGDYEGTKALWEKFHQLVAQGKVKAAWAVTNAGVGEGIMKMSFGNEIGFSGNDSCTADLLFQPNSGSIVAELTEDVSFGLRIGKTSFVPMIEAAGAFISIHDLRAVWETTLEDVYPTRTEADIQEEEVDELDTDARLNCHGNGGGDEEEEMEPITFETRSSAKPVTQAARPRAVIPVFPGTNCEYDTAMACLRAGIEPEILVVRNLNTQLLTESADALAEAIGRSQMIVLPGGFSGGDEPEGSGKFIASFFRNPKITDAVHELLKQRDGLMLGICNGFQALVKLGLVPYGEIRPMDNTCPTLTFNLIGRHQSRYVTTRVASVNSPWMLKSEVDDLYTVPVSHGEGRFVAPPEILASMKEQGQIATQYVDVVTGLPTMGIAGNPNGSMEAIEGIFSPDGRVFGKMGHSERYGDLVAKNIPGNKHMPLFESGALYFK
jgi:phosphoribosylformylglycinamidine synthase